MKAKIKLLISGFCIFICCVPLIAWGWANILFLSPTIKATMEQATITKEELFVVFLGGNIPNEKLEKFQNISGEDLNRGSNTGSVSLYVIVPSLILTAIITTILFYFIKSVKKRRRQKRLMIEDNILRKNYFLKYPVPKNIFSAFCTDGIISDATLSSTRVIIWFESDIMYMINGNYRNDIGKFQISLNDVVCFSRYGDFYTSTNIQGGGSSVNRAIAGYLIAGGVGAVIASRNPISSSTTIHEKRETLVIYRDNMTEKYLFFEPSLYEILMHQMPNKEITYFSHRNSSANDDQKIDKLIKLGELKGLGHISEEEFTKLKQELINKN